MKPLTRVAAVALALGLSASQAAAQLLANPVYFSPKGGVGLTIAGDFGRGLNNQSGKTQAYGGHLTLGLPMVAITVGGGLWDSRVAGADKEVQFMGAAEVGVLKMPVAISIRAGAGYIKDIAGAGTTTMNFPIGVGLALNVPTPSLSVEPWVAPRIHIARASGGGASVSSTDFGVSGGLNLGLPMGLGFHVAGDYLDEAITVGIGIHYKITIPGLGAVPGM
jgi:hypothetical protein